MQVLSAYLLESGELGGDQAAALREKVCSSLEKWLRSKGASDPTAEAGRFSPLYGTSQGTFSRTLTENAAGSVDELQLVEDADAGRRFVTTISVVSTQNRVVTYVALAILNLSTALTPVRTTPRCPSVVRELLALHPWSVGDELVPHPVCRAVEGEDAGLELAKWLQSSKRVFPVLLISQLDGEPIWQALPEQAAADLSAASRVFVIDEAASSAIESVVGKINSCYSGAVRLYWPTRGQNTKSLPGVCWTPRTLLGHDREGEGLNWLRSELRRQVMAAAAVSLEPPPGIREIFAYKSRQKLREMEERLAANSEELDLARLFVEENERLELILADVRQQAQVESQKATMREQELETELERLELESARLRGRAEVAEFQLQELKVAEDDSALVFDETVEEEPAPRRGEVRFYKKTHSKANYDVMVRIDDCGHNAWQGAHSADKASKGIARLEKSGEWRTLNHCGSCTGGGVWRVVW